jgi:uncharacterized OsmC-like protein
MKISAIIKNELNRNDIEVATNNQAKSIAIVSKESGYGSSVNGGELLALSLAVCFCNDIYREATKRNLTVTKVEVEVLCDFGAEGEPGANFSYRPIIESTASKEQLRDLIIHTDRIAEIHKTLRQGIDVKLVQE